VKTNTKFIQPVVFFTSFTILCYEIILTRIFAITQWQNLAAFIISLALLGFGASGTGIALLKNQIEKHFNGFVLTALFLYPLSMCMGFILYCKTPFNPFEIGIDNRQLYYFLQYFIAMGIPFFFGATVIGIALTKFPIGKTYFSNLIGSGIGAIFVILVSYFLHPYSILIGITIISFLTAIIFSFRGCNNLTITYGKDKSASNVRRISRYIRKKVILLHPLNLKKRVFITNLLLSIVIVALFCYSVDYLDLKKISQYKSISKTLNLPDSKIIKERYSPLGLVQVVEAEGLRSTVGLSLVSPYEVPIQKGIFFDGEAMSAITPFDGAKEEIKYLNYIPSALPYNILDDSEKEKVLIVGVGGGEGTLKALLHDFKNISGLELNRKVVKLMKDDYSKFSGNIYNHPRVTIINNEARGFIQSTREKYNLIEISMLDTYNTAASGIYALNETNLYTVESIREFFLHLKENGLLAITRWVVNPPRDNLKMLNICIHALKSLDIKDISKHIIYIRTIQAATLIISKNPVSEKMINKTKEFCKRRLFDIIYYDGIKENEVNRFVKLDTPIYYLATKNLLSERASDFINEYDFDIKPATDNRPYFYNFFKYKTLKYILKYGTDKIPFTEWGYLTLIILLIPVIIISFVLIVVPLLFLKKGKRGLNVKILLFFGLIGIGFFFIEMPLIQKLILFLSHPTYSLSVIISSLLVFSGIGSYFSDKIFKEEKRILYSTLLIVSIIILYLLTFDIVLPVFMNANVIIKILVTIILLAPLGFFMGIPFPQGLSMIKRIESFKVPWAWGINGFFSVISTILATLFAILFGFKVVFVLATLCYLGAGIVSLELNKA